MSEDSDVVDEEPSPPDGSDSADSADSADSDDADDPRADDVASDPGDSAAASDRTHDDTAEEESVDSATAGEQADEGDPGAAETDVDRDVDPDAESAAGEDAGHVSEGDSESHADDDADPDTDDAEDGAAAPATEPVMPSESADAGAPYADDETQSFVADDDRILGEGPESDQEMPLADHIEEMMRRLGVVFLVAGTATLLVYGVGQFVEPIPSAIEIINYLWNHNIPGAPQIEDRRPRLYGPLELVLTELKVAGLAGLVVGLPAFVYETYRFMRPGLYPHERRYYLAAVPTSLVLALVGITFANFVVVPAIFSYFTSYTEASGTVVAFGLRETFNLILLLMGYMAVVFQIPLFMMLAIMMNLTSRQWMEDRRLLFWGGFLGLAFVVSPDPTGMAPIIIAATMITLFEGTLALLRWTGN